MNQDLLGPVDLKQILNKFKTTLLKGINCARVGKIESVDYENQTVNVEIKDLPKIEKIPFFFICGVDYSIQVPIQQGDDCLVLFCDYDLDNWLEGNGYTPGISSDIHGLNGAIALCGIKNQSTKITYAQNAVKVNYKGTELTLNDGNVTINKNTIITGKLTVNGDIEATGNITSTGGDVIASGISLKNHKHGAGSYSNSGGAVSGISDIPQ